MNKNIGKIIKLNRTFNNLKQEYVAEQLGMSVSRYGRIEKNMVELSDEEVVKAFSILGLEYSVSDIDNEFEKDFYTFVREFTYFNPFDDLYHKLESYYPSICSSLSYPKYLLTKLIYLVKTSCKFDINEYLYLEDYFEYLDGYHIQLYYDMIAVYYIQREKHRESEGYFKKALSYKGNILTKSMILYHQCLAYRNLGRYSECLRYVEEARTDFIESLNLKRLVMIEFMDGLVNQHMNNVEYGLKKYFYCLKAYKKLNMHNSIHNTYNSILWTYMKDGQYENVLKIKDEALEAIPDDAYFYFIIAYTYYKIKDYKSAKHYIDQAMIYLPDSRTLFKVDEHDEFKINIINALYIILYDSNYKDIEISLLSVYDSSIKCQDREVEEFSIKLLCDFYRTHNTKDQLSYYLLKLNECQQRIG